MIKKKKVIRLADKGKKVKSIPRDFVPTDYFDEEDEFTRSSTFLADSAKVSTSAKYFLLVSPYSSPCLSRPGAGFIHTMQTREPPQK